MKSGNASRDLATAILQDDIANYAKGDRTLSEASLKAADINGDGKITITDLSTLNSIYVNKKNVEEIRKKAADLDYSGKITITDISMMNQAIVEKKEL